MEVIKKEFYLSIKQDWIKQSGLTEAEFEKEISFAIQHIHKNPLLQKCDPVSILRSVTNLAQVGLTLNPVSKYAYLIPRWNNLKKIYECVLEPDYRGLAKLLTDTGIIKSIETNVVYEGDEVEIDMASDVKVKKHIPWWLNKKPHGEVLGVYDVATLNDGSRHFEGMSVSDVWEVRDRSESYKAFKAGKISTCIWETDFPEMCRKTIIKRHYKYLPKSGNMERLEKAIDLDNQVNGFDEELDFGLAQWIEIMISQATLNGDEKSKYTNRLCKAKTKSEGYELIEELKEYQPIMGLQSIPTNVGQAAEATRFAVDKDDFHEQRWNKNQ